MWHESHTTCRLRCWQRWVRLPVRWGFRRFVSRSPPSERGLRRLKAPCRSCPPSPWRSLTRSFLSDAAQSWERLLLDGVDDHVDRIVAEFVAAIVAVVVWGSPPAALRIACPVRKRWRPASSLIRLAMILILAIGISWPRSDRSRQAGILGSSVRATDRQR